MHGVTDAPHNPPPRCPVLLPFALGSGLLLSLAVAPYGLWPLAFVAVAGLAVVVRLASGYRAAAWLGLAFGVGYAGVSLLWQTMIRTESYLGLTLVVALFSAALAPMLRRVRTVPFEPVWSACCWTLTELVLQYWPFGGFQWLRLGYTMVDSPLAGFYPFTGAASVTFFVALIGHLLARAVLNRTGRDALVAAAATIGVLLAGWAGTRWSPDAASTGTVPVGYVQGGAPGGGIYGLGPARSIAYAHASETRNLMGRVRAGELPKPAFIAWPENSTDVDPFLDAETNSIVRAAVAAADLPILVGGITQGPDDGERQTVALWWTTDNQVPVRYIKRNIVPFGEWIPLRELLLPLIPLLQYVGDQSVPGTAPGALPVTLGNGEKLTLGVAICYEVIYASTLYEAVDAGAEVMIVQSSNAMYQGSPQIEQQWAITRVRAAEMRRQILVVTTSGVSGLIGPQGQVVERLEQHRGASDVVELDRTRVRTPVMDGGWLFEWFTAGLALIAVSLAFIRRRSWTDAPQWSEAGPSATREGSAA